MPECPKCGRVLRPNINMRDDLDWMEDKVSKQHERMYQFLQRPDINKHSVTILEIGAGPVQPLARSFGETFLKNDKYRCALIRINPVKERLSQYAHEQAQFEDLIKQRHLLAQAGQKGKPL